MSNSSTRHIDRTLSDPPTSGQSEPRSDGNEEIFCIPQSITGHIQDTFGGDLPSVEMQSVYSTALADWAIGYFRRAEFIAITLNPL